MATLHAPHDLRSSTGDIYTISSVDTNAPLRWLKMGFADMKKSPLASLTYGLIDFLGAHCGDSDWVFCEGC